MSYNAILKDYFHQLSDGDYSQTALLSPIEVQEYSDEFSFHPAVQQLGGYVVDELDTSNHHLLVTTGPLAGSVYYLSHDDDSRVVFASASDFLAAVLEAHETEQEICDLHPALSPLANDQSALSTLITELLDSSDDEAEDLLPSLLPSADLTDLTLLQRLATSDNFYLGEALANEIIKRPSAHLLPIAQLCAAHTHSQVSGVGAEAVRSIQGRKA
ncbi:MAG: hypothetical protein ACTJHW_00355 [Paenalcaligenes sp.]